MMAGRVGRCRPAERIAKVAFAHVAGDSTLIIIFILLGLGFLCGGVAAIVDGLPYMVLERGFTQVIIGTVVAVAGVVMLALAWVLVEVRRLKSTLSGAAMAMSVASMVGSPVAGGDAPTPRMTSGSGDAGGTRQSALVAAGAGTLAGAALAGTQALGAAGGQGGFAGEPAEADDKAAAPGLFGTYLAQQPAPEAGDGRALPEHARDADLLPAFDPFRPVDPQGEREPETETETETAAAPPEPALPMVLPHEPDAERAAATPDGPGETGESGLPDVLPEIDDGFAPAPGPSDIDDPLAAAVAPPSREDDEFGLLRESLAGLRFESGLPGGRLEPSFAEIASSDAPAGERPGGPPDDLAAAGSWMESAPRRQAPWFAEPAAASQDDRAAPPDVAPLDAISEASWPKPDVSGPEVPHWPPQTREADSFEPAAPAPAPAEDAAPAPDSPEPDVAGEAAAPAASDEGIVGAYQVGEAHFTIYADGSIQARTPDGDYSFTSMDELKIYLASEKSRLGV